MGFLKKVFGASKDGGQENVSKADKLVEKGSRELDDNNLDKAMKLFTKAIELDPNHYDAYFSRSTCFLSLQMFDQAFEDATKCIELNPDRYEGFFCRARCLHKMGQPVKAIPDFYRAVELDPEYAEILTRRGHVLFELNCFDLALADFQKAAKLDPEREGWNIAASWDALECPQQALEAYQECLSNDPSAPSQTVENARQRIAELSHIIQNNLYRSFGEHSAKAMSLMNTKQYDERAAEHARAIVKCDNGLGRFLDYFVRGEMFYSLGIDDLALYDFTQAVHANPESPEAYADRGDVHLQMEHHDLAEKDYLKALSLHPKNDTFTDVLSGKEIFHEYSPNAASVYDSLGLVYFNTGRVREAIENFKIAVKIEPNNVEYQQHLETALQNESKTQE